MIINEVKGVFDLIGEFCWVVKGVDIGVFVCFDFGVVSDEWVKIGY